MKYLSDVQPSKYSEKTMEAVASASLLFLAPQLQTFQAGGNQCTYGNCLRSREDAHRHQGSHTLLELLLPKFEDL